MAASSMASIVITSIGVASTGEVIRTAIAPVAENASITPSFVSYGLAASEAELQPTVPPAHLGCGRPFDKESSRHWFGWMQRTVAANLKSNFRLVLDVSFEF
jgi:hypothetical protein